MLQAERAKFPTSTIAEAIDNGSTALEFPSFVQSTSQYEREVSGN
jgi:hypothetical protein